MFEHNGNINIKCMLRLLHAWKHLYSVAEFESKIRETNLTNKKNYDAKLIERRRYFVAQIITDLKNVFSKSCYDQTMEHYI